MLYMYICYSILERQLLAWRGVLEAHFLVFCLLNHCPAIKNQAPSLWGSVVFCCSVLGLVFPKNEKGDGDPSPGLVYSSDLKVLNDSINTGATT